MTRATKLEPARRIVEGWSAVSSVAVAQSGRVVAGENGGFRVACWDESGALAWQIPLKKAVKRSSRYQYESFVAVDGDRVLALAKYGDAMSVLDLATGKLAKKHALPKGTRAFALMMDRKRIVLRVETETLVAEWPSLKKIAKLDEYCNMDCIAIAPNGKWFAVCGHEVHVYDAKKLVHRKTFEPPEAPWSMCASASGEQLITGDQRNMLCIYDAQNDFVKLVETGKNRSPTITAIAASDDGKWIATANERGTVNVHRAGTLEIACELKGHDPSQPDTVGGSISSLAFLPSGELVVGAAPKKAPSGLTVHTLP